jgi:hypothetical protein
MKARFVETALQTGVAGKGQSGAIALIFGEEFAWH